MKIRADGRNRQVPMVFICRDLIYENFLRNAEALYPFVYIPAPIKIDDLKLHVLNYITPNVGLKSINKRESEPQTYRGIYKLQKYTTILEKSSEIIVIAASDYRIQSWNRMFEEKVGKETAARIENLRIQDIFFSPKIAINSIIEDLSKNKEWIGELNLLTADNREIITHSRLFLFHDEAMHSESIIIIAEDITEKLNLKKQLERAQRMESIGALTSGTAHDINNLLSPIVLGVSLLRDHTNDPYTIKVLDLIEGNAKRAADVLKSILTYAKAVPGHRIVMNPKHVIRDVLGIVAETFPKNISLKSSVPTDLWTIKGDATQLHQVFLNLVINARDAMPDGGVLEIRAKNIEVDDNVIKFVPEANPGPYVVVSVIDTGVGIPSDIIDKIFEPFFTTKTPEIGTGLGLSTSLGIVESHGGFIKVKSVVGTGSTFDVWLPASPGEKERVFDAKKPVYTGNGEMVLVVDDEKNILDVTRSILEKHGYKAITARNGIEAVGEIARNRALIKVVVCDIDMPQMDGPSTMRAIRVYEPTLPIIVMTGYTSPSHETKMEKIKIAAKIYKPFMPDEFLEVLYKAIHGIPINAKY